MWAHRLRRALLDPIRRLPPTALGQFQILALLPRLDLRLTALLSLLVLAGGGLPLTFAFVSGVLIGSIPDAIAQGPGSPASATTVRAFVVIAAVFAAQRCAGPIRGIVASQLAQRLEQHLEERVMRAVCAPTDIAHLEDPVTLDRIGKAQDVSTGGWKPGDAVTALANIAPLWLLSVGSAVVLGSLHWWLGAGVLVVSIYVSRIHRREYLRSIAVMRGSTNSLRRANYFRDLALTPAFGKEVRLFGMGDWLAARFSSEWARTMASIWRARDRGMRAQAWATVLDAGVTGMALAYVGWVAVEGAISLTTLAVMVGMIYRVRAIGTLGTDDMRLEWGATAVPAVLELERLLEVPGGRNRRPRVANERREGAAYVPAAGGIRFDGVTFRYPGSDRDTIARLTLDIPAGQSLAIVGANGAGKTTLIKLLCRLYEPQAGRIMVDGTSLRELAPDVWLRRVAAIFQDFVQYELPARDNVGFGALSYAGNTELLENAARQAGVLEIIKSLPRQWDTILSREFTGGVDLSGGQWQRVALARALFAVNGGADVLILDEPTASLDVRAEAELYDRFLDITRGLTTILVSHRFSTVRRAHRICVLEDGHASEQGTHEELMALRGRYAEMFSLQAARFSESEPGMLAAQ